MQKVGQLASRLGTTVRSLHHYEDIGLLSPRRDPQSGHRIYGAGDVRRLQKIQFLRTLGLSLGEIRDLLEPTEVSVHQVLELHRNRLTRQMAEISSILGRLNGLAARLEAGTEPTAEELFSLLETMMNFEKYYTKEQLAELGNRRDALGEEGMRKGQQDWQDLIAEVRAEVEARTSPDSPKGRELAERWEALIEAFTGGDPGIRESLANAYRSQPGAMGQFGIDPSMQEFIGKASTKD